MATRHQVRQAVISLLYAQEMGSEMSEFKDEFLEEKKIRNEQRNFTTSLYDGVNENLTALDELLNSHLKEYKIHEIGVVERAILRLGAYEMKFTDTDKAVVINEAIELAKELGSDSAPKFINGVLDAVRSDI
ncbi:MULTISPECIES: transcription antitermination factor NusB [Campylobacter]|uniref:transcription antitermination factor NusB n=1 Tax=Campylobacter TaxID=194 RepID=UPI0014518F30|nr:MULTISPECIES: transcription antitermination factor NusB [unclassified Campylobacter]QCD52111.1 transcription antitermination protein [Campylobacter sp. RM16192]QKF91746.1 transcription antitermination protein [Campylobacter sp. CCUG 57310]